MESNAKAGRRRGYLMLIGTIIVAVMFVSSYLVSNNSQGSATTTKTTIPSNVKSYFATNDSVPATLRGYGSTLSLTIANNTTDINSVTGILSNLTSEGAISYTPRGNTFSVLLFSNLTPYSLEQELSNAIGPASIKNASAVAYVSLPAIVPMYIGGQPIRVAIGNSTQYPITLPRLEPEESFVLVGVQALVTTSGQVYNNSIRVIYK
ncbi:hypothetical protein M1329_02160 [Candidatus Marsarchaeota archaeon]|nr:hypothetical protein [Candidatus Marsarchaeota archaeon]MCL5100163.1 hypothetical protein [Candidatus Marsarchaeota archaeon]